MELQLRETLVNTELAGLSQAANRPAKNAFMETKLDMKTSKLEKFWFLHSQ